MHSSLRFALAFCAWWATSAAQETEWSDWKPDFQQPSLTRSAEAQQHPFGQGPNGDLGFLQSKVSAQSELSRSQAKKQRLMSENAILRKELERWHTAAEHVAAREAWAARLLMAPEAPAHAAKQSLPEGAISLAARVPTARRMPQELDEAPAALASMKEPLPMAAVEEKASATYSERAWAAVPSGHSGLLQFSFLAILLVFAMVFASTCGCMAGGSKGQSDWRDSVSMACGGSSRPRIDAALRRLGVSHYKIEISEIHVGSLLSGGSIHVRISSDVGEWYRTQAIVQDDGSFMRFKETAVLNVRLSDGPYVVAVYNDQGELARLSMRPMELVQLAQRRHREFYRAELEADEQRLQDLNKGRDSTRKPYAAMRIRDVTVTQPQEDAQMASCRGGRPLAV
mmetsp:Transcript_30905/g.67712  ORF Transcript_30905/g.67712 Transcript_30905/m.67712 type:complete len:398 (-) Transcript_30905:118-1311(-)